MIMSSKNITLSNPFFHNEILNKNRKWKRLAISYPFIEYNRGSSISGVLKSKIHLFLLLQLHEQNLKLFRFFCDRLNLTLTTSVISHYQSKTETILKNFQNIFHLSVLENRTININKKPNTNSIVLKNRILFSCTTTYMSNFVSKNITLLNPSTDSLNIFLKSFSRSQSSRLESNFTGKITRNKIERFIDKTKKSNLAFILELPEILSNQMGSGLSNKKKFLNRSNFQRNSFFFCRTIFLRDITAFENIDLSTGMRGLKSKDSSNIRGVLNYRITESLGIRAFSNYDNLLNDLSFLNRVHLLSSTSFLKGFRLLYTQNFVKLSLKTGFLNTKKRNEVKIENLGHDSAQNLNLLKVKSLGNIRSKFEFKVFSPSYLPKLTSENLFFTRKKINFSIFANQTPDVSKKTLMLPFSDVDTGNKEAASFSGKRKKLLFAADNRSFGLEQRRDQDFHMNTQGFIFHTQSEIEQKMEEKIEQKIRQKIEQVRKVAVEAKEAISEQARESKKNQLDINHISDQVFRLMEQKLKIERERRGIL